MAVSFREGNDNAFACMTEQLGWKWNIFSINHDNTVYSIQYSCQFFVTNLGWWKRAPFQRLLVTSNVWGYKGHGLNHLVHMYNDNSVFIYLFIYIHTIQGVPIQPWRMVNWHPFGTIWHPLEGPGTCIYLCICIYRCFSFAWGFLETFVARQVWQNMTGTTMDEHLAKQVQWWGYNYGPLAFLIVSLIRW